MQLPLPFTSAALQLCPPPEIATVPVGITAAMAVAIFDLLALALVPVGSALLLTVTDAATD